MEPKLRRDLEELHEASFAWALACCAWRREEAEDVLQSAYVKVLDGRARFDGRASVKTWLFAVIRNTAADRRRKSWLWSLGLDRLRARRVEPAGESSDEAARRLRVRAALGELAARQREVLDLVFYHELTIEEAARVMGVSVGSARVHYDRGKKRLAERLR
ncbi:MAG TPA: sigma-70 family RNA polymerase sigma factor [Polyangia bacterium]|jgi:RNA polymerase sigma-70 factor (ECF subfamily)